MSMQTMQTILCRAAVDRRFQAELLSNPDDIVQEYGLHESEAGMLAGPLGSLGELASVVEAWRRGDPTCMPARELALAS